MIPRFAWLLIIFSTNPCKMCWRAAERTIKRAIQMMLVGWNHVYLYCKSITGRCAKVGMNTFPNRVDQCAQPFDNWFDWEFPSLCSHTACVLLLWYVIHMLSLLWIEAILLRKNSNYHEHLCNFVQCFSGQEEAELNIVFCMLHTMTYAQYIIVSRCIRALRCTRHAIVRNIL